MRLAHLLVTSLLATGCYAQGRVAVRGSATVAAPELVYVAPGVRVVADADLPVFYAEGVYWRYDGGVWYRAPRYGAGWTVTTSVPVVVRRIDRPARYARYRAPARDHRAPVAIRARAPRTAPPGRVVRDHRH